MLKNNPAIYHSAFSNIYLDCTQIHYLKSLLSVCSVLFRDNIMVPSLVYLLVLILFYLLFCNKPAINPAIYIMYNHTCVIAVSDSCEYFTDCTHISVRGCVVAVHYPGRDCQGSVQHLCKGQGSQEVVCLVSKAT